MKANLATREPAMLADWYAKRSLRGNPEAHGGAQARVRPARRPAVCEWRDPHRPRGQQGAQGHRRQVEAAGRFPFALCAGLGLPWPADRDRRREGIRQGRAEARCRRVPPEVPRIRDEADRPAARGLQAPRRARRLGQPVSHHGREIRGRHAARTGEDLRQRPCHARLQAGALVLRLRLGAGRSRDRIRRQGFAGGRCRLRRDRSEGAGGEIRCRDRRRHDRRRADLDDHAVDAAGQPGRVARARISNTCWSKGRRATAGASCW